MRASAAEEKALLIKVKSDRNIVLMVIWGKASL
jgi:hypothetical protein